MDKQTIAGRGVRGAVVISVAMLAVAAGSEAGGGSDYSGEFARLVWSDEFDGAGLPDPAKWGYEEGFVRNEEEQFYTQARERNCRREGGCLVIEAIHEDWANPKWQAGSKDWRTQRKSAGFTSASIHTLGKAGWERGRVEVRAKLPTGKGVWPAIWMMGVNRPQVGWPACGEIDIMEYVTSTPRTLYATMHWPAPAGAAKKSVSSGGKRELATPGEFHVYAMEKTDRAVTFFLDGKKYFEFPLNKANGADGANPFKGKEFYLLLNLAVGGSWGGKADPAVYPQKYLVDYVRVYQ